MQFEAKFTNLMHNKNISDKVMCGLYCLNIV